jgi:ribose 5-phosphate isomerase A
MITKSEQDQEKFLAASASIELIEDGMRVGLGTGSTAAHAVKLLGKRVKEGLRVQCVCTSLSTETLAKQEGIAIFNLSEVPELDIAIDGADESDHNLQLIKGGGGALTREKVVASVAKAFIVIVDSSKFVQTLGAFPLPIEVIPFAVPAVQRRLLDLGASSVRLRKAKSESEFLTDQGNYILDCDFGQITNPKTLASQLDSICGVVEHGLFVDMTSKLIIGQNGQVKVINK